VRSALRSLRKLVLGETWTIPLGVAAALVLAVGLRDSLPEATWKAAGGFCLALFVLASLGYSLRQSRGGRR
jgi:hypothetical protein